jgi:hypothetical protein
MNEKKAQMIAIWMIPPTRPRQIPAFYAQRQRLRVVSALNPVTDHA